MVDDVQEPESAAKKKPFVSSLHVNRSLLDVNFEGYKLIVETLPTTVCKLPGVVTARTAGENQWSYQSSKLFGEHNHLHVDPFVTDSVTAYVFVESPAGTTLYGFNFHSDRGWSSGHVVAELPCPSSVSGNNSGPSCEFNPTLTFVDSTTAVLADGLGSLTLFATGQRDQLQRWKVDFCETPLLSIGGISDTDAAKGDLQPGFVILDATRISETAIDCLLMTVEDGKPATDNPSVKIGHHLSRLYWISLTKMTVNDVWCRSRCRLVETGGLLEYASFGDANSSLIVASTDDPVFTVDTQKPIALSTNHDHGTEVDVEAVKKIYEWRQTSDEILIIYAAPDGPDGQQGTIDKSRVEWSLSRDAIRVAIEGRVIINGELEATVDVDQSNWTLEENGQRLEVTLVKADPGRGWTEVVEGDTSGEYRPDPNLVEEMADRLKHFTSELEECDVNERTLQMYWLDGESHHATHQVDLAGHQWLFHQKHIEQSIADDGTRSNAYSRLACLRHDVDGLLWRIGDDGAIEHSGTLNAFGYVQASKQQRKYSISAPDCGYSAIIEGRARAFLYFHQCSVASELRNRKTGKQVLQMAKQNLVNLENPNELILGCHPLNNTLLLLTENNLYAVKMKSVS